MHENTQIVETLEANKSDQPSVASLTEEQRTVLLHFPDEHASVRILEILLPFSKQARELILAAVEANLAAGYPRIRMSGSEWPEGIRMVRVPER
jgi:hypothetical protein